VVCQGLEPDTWVKSITSPASVLFGEDQRVL
jgi:hypothetical protein